MAWRKIIIVWMLVLNDAEKNQYDFSDWADWHSFLIRRLIDNLGLCPKPRFTGQKLLGVYGQTKDSADLIGEPNVIYG